MTPDICSSCGVMLPSDGRLAGVCVACAYALALDSAPRADSTVARGPIDPEPSRMIGPYRLVQKIGEGGMGEVWQGEQTEPVRRRVALKLIKPGIDTSQVIARFEAERQALAMMDHPCVSKMLDAGTTEEGRPFFVMEYVSGLPITEHCDRHTLTTRERLELFLQVCDGVQHAHQKAIIHRDLKPSNVLVSIQDGVAVPKIIDFGVAKATAQRLTERSLFTEVGVLIGTPEYMSPEQADLTVQDVDTRTDVYALGVMLYELLSGALPFESKTLRRAGLDGIRRMIREVEPPKPSTRLTTLGAERSTETARQRSVDPPTLRRQLTGDLDWITMKALEKDRTRRYGAPSELAADLKRHLGDLPVLAGPPSARYRAGKFVRRHRLGVTVSALAGLALAVFAVSMAVQARRISIARHRAERVSELLTDLFTVSDPSESRGNAVTAREILDKGAVRIEKDLAGEPEVQAQLMRTMGKVYRGLGLYPEAESLLTRSLEIQRRLLGERDPDTLRSMDGLARLYEQQGRYVDAEKLAAETVALRRSVLGERHPDTLASTDALAIAYERQGRYDEAEKLYREALEGRRQVLGSDHPDTLTSLDGLASIFMSRGRYAEAEKLYREEIDGRTRTQGADHPSTLWAMNNLGLVYFGQGRYPEAEEMHRRTLETRRRVLGEAHPRTAASMANLAEVYSVTGRKNEAAKLFEAVLEINERVLGKDHRNTLGAMGSVAGVYFDMGRKDEAEKLYREALEASRRVLGKAHPDTLTAMNKLASVCLDLGRLDEAESLYREALESGRRTPGEEHPDTLSSLAGLADVRVKRADYDEAEKMYRHALEVRSRVLGDDHPDTVACRYRLARVAALRGDRAKALDWLRQSVEHGYSNADELAKDPDLDSLRGDAELERLLAAARKNAEK